MFIERLFNQGNGPLLEQTLKFTQARARLIGENVVNLSTPGYRQKDLDESKFRAALIERVATRDSAPPGSVDFGDVVGEVDNPRAGALFYDGANRSAEQLMTDQAKNGMMHNLVVELLKRQFAAIELALKERP
jgi:flagellar basal-body rod protein FlgB